MSDELMITSSLDQAVDTEHQAFIDWIKQKANESIEKKDITIILQPLLDSVKITKMSGLGLACGLYMIQKNWDTYEIDDEFTDYIFVTLGLHVHTIERYVTVWSMYDNHVIPNKLALKIMQQNIKSQIPIAKAIGQGYEIDDETWEDLANATDYSEVARIVRDVKGTAPRKGSLQMFLDRDGSIKCVFDGDIYDIGYLDIFSEELAVQKATDRIISNSGILRR